MKSGHVWEIPFEELHEQADVEDASQDEEEAVPQADAGVERWEVQVVVVADSSDHCRDATRFNQTQRPVVCLHAALQTSHCSGNVL